MENFEESITLMYNALHLVDNEDIERSVKEKYKDFSSALDFIEDCYNLEQMIKAEKEQNRISPELEEKANFVFEKVKEFLNSALIDNKSDTHKDLVEGLMREEQEYGTTMSTISNLDKFVTESKPHQEKSIPSFLKIGKDEKLKGKKVVSGSKKAYISAPPQMG